MMKNLISILIILGIFPYVNMENEKNPNSRRMNFLFFEKVKRFSGANLAPFSVRFRFAFHRIIGSSGR